MAITWVNGMCNPCVSTVEVFRRLAGSNLPAVEDLTPAIVPRRLSTGEALFQADEIKPFAFVVNVGVVKFVYETPDGDSWIKGFAQAGECFASLTALQDGGTTSFSAYAVAESAIDQIEYGKLQQLGDRHIEWQRAISNAFKHYGQRKEQREMELLTHSPEERYLRFLRKHPELAALIRQRDIASYIRVTPVALSRIRARLKAKGQLT